MDQDDAIEHEENEEERAKRFQMSSDTRKVVPSIVTEVIEAMRYVLAQKMLDRGGTEQFHLRNIFLKYDVDLSSTLDKRELMLALQQNLKLDISLEQAERIIW